MADAHHIFLPAPHRRLEAEELALLAETLDPIDGQGLFSSETVGEVFRLDFYAGTDLIRLTDPAWLPEGVCVYLIRLEDDEIYRLDGTSPPIHMLNAVVPLMLTEALAASYLRFFCFFVRGDEGPFHICAEAADPLLPAEATDVTQHVEPPRSYGVDSDGQFRLSAPVYYGDAVFRSDFLVSPTGMIEMLEDQPLATDLPAKIAAPIVVTNSGKRD